jgi:hypothetical protein
MDKRLIILETRFDTILPMLATKADLAELRAEMKADLKEAMAGVHKWLAAICISLLLGFGAISLAMVSAIQALPSMVQEAVAAQIKTR